MAHTFTHNSAGVLSPNRRYKFDIQGRNPNDLLELENRIRTHLDFFNKGLVEGLKSISPSDPKAYYDSFVSVYNRLKPTSLDTLARIIHNFMSTHDSVTDVVSNYQFYDGYNYVTLVQVVVTTNPKMLIANIPTEGIATLATGCKGKRAISSIHSTIAYLRQYSSSLYTPQLIDVWEHPQQYGGWKPLQGAIGNVTLYGYCLADLDADFAFEDKFLKSLQEATTAPPVPSTVDISPASPTLMEELRAAARQLEHHDYMRNYDRAVNNAYLDNAPSPAGRAPIPWAASEWQRLPTPRTEPTPITLNIRPTVGFVDVPFSGSVLDVTGVYTMEHVREPYYSRTIEYGLNEHGQRIARRIIDDELVRRHSANTSAPVRNDP